MKNIIIYTDTGVDDAFAILYALHHPTLHVLAIVASYGNVSAEKATRNVYYLLKETNNEHIPIISGASTSLTGEEPTFYEEIHGYSGLGDIDTGIEEFTVKNFDQLFNIMKEHRDITIVNIGRLTSLAMSYIIAPEVMKQIKHIVVMGGAFLVPGNVTPYAEANFFADPTAVSVVIQNTAPEYLTLSPLNVTEKAIVTEAMINTIQENADTKLGKLLPTLFKPYYSFYKQKNMQAKGAPLHDLVAMMYITYPSLFQYLQRNVYIEEHSLYAKGMSLADFRRKPKINKKDNSYCKILLHMDSTEFMERFTNTMIGSV
ncbi:nucleoside hydrolase [Pontibacillus salicampi]|uniref:Nucleoside hydrolase n=1 Tax=Pontibacillus salicampi TaxID=1449801 RepID=A0ABV6LPX8_9BACI